MDTKPRIKFSLLEKIEFYDDREMKLFGKVYPKIKLEDLQKYVQLSVNDMCKSDEREEDDEVELPLEALAVRKLMDVLHRESLHCDRDEIIEYLTSLSFGVEECKELTKLVMDRSIFSNVPKFIRLRPTITSMHWMIDLSYFQRMLNKCVESEHKKNLHNMLRIILLISLSDGRKKSLYLRCGRESWLRYVFRMASQGLTRTDACSLQNVESEVQENE